MMMRHGNSEFKKRKEKKEKDFVCTNSTYILGLSNIRIYIKGNMYTLRKYIDRL